MSLKNQNINFVDLSGYLFSGKSAVSNLLQEIKGFYSPDVEEDFELIRIQGGLADLEEALVKRWSLVRTDAAIRRFKKTIDIIGRNPVGMERLYRFGWGYGRRYPGFQKEADAMINKMVIQTVRQEWPFPLIDSEKSALEVFLSKIRRKILRSFVLWPRVDFYWADGSDFYQHVQTFMDNIFAASVDSGVNNIVINNALEPYCPQNYFRFFRSIKSIVVDRDPRDCYITALQYAENNKKFKNIFTDMTCAHDIDAFIKRIKLQRANTCREKHSNILRINFEDLVMEYEATKTQIFNFLQIREDDHVRKYEYFDPKKSVNNCYAWREYHDQITINKISHELDLNY